MDGVKSRRSWSSGLLKPLLAAFALACLLVPRATAQPAVTLYVAPDGSGTNWSADQPGSLPDVIGQVRTLNANMTGDILVYLYGGTYHLAAGLQFRANSGTNDSGSNGHNIIYQAFPGQVPVLSGGLNVTGWTLYNSANNIYRAYAGTNLASRQLYVNGVRAVRARGPQNPSGFTMNSAGFTTSNTKMQTWGNPTNIEIVTRNDWKHFRCPVASIVGSQITMQTPCWTYSGVSPTPGHPWNGGGTVSMTSVSWVENAYELLASPGQWYLDQSTGYLYYIPKPGENLATATVILPTGEKLIDAAGSPGAPLHNLVFSGLTFADATWLGPSSPSGYADNQAGILWAGPTTPAKSLGNISFHTVSNIVLANNIFQRLGGVAIDFGGGSQSNTIVGNRISDVSSGGITLGEVTDYAYRAPSELTDGNVIMDNSIHEIGLEFEDAVGIWVGYARNTLIAHNKIDNVPYSGMSVGWGWGTYSYSQNNQVNSNLVAHVMQTLNDGGSIYTLSGQTNSRINGNYLRNSGNQGIYWDEGTAYYGAGSNIFDQILGNYVNIWTSSIHNNTATNNFSNTTNYNNSGTACIVSRTTIVTNENWPPAAQDIIQTAGLEPAYRLIDNAIVVVNDSALDASNYLGSWEYQTNRPPGDYDGDAHTTANNGDSVQYTFFGTGLSVISEKNANEGNVAISLDGVYQATVDCRNAARLPQQTIYSLNHLPLQHHTVTLTKLDGAAMLLDAFLVRSDPEIFVNDADMILDHAPSDWSYYSSRSLGDYNGDVHATTINGQYLQYTFTGVGIRVLAEVNSDEGLVAISLDGVAQPSVNCSNITRLAQQTIYSTNGLAAGSHTIRLTKQSGSYMVIDAVAITPVDYGIPRPTASFQGTNISLTWTGGAAPYTIQSSPDLSTTNWTTLVSLTNNTIALPATNPAAFFRVLSQ